MSDADQIKLWKAALVLCDGRMTFPRALRKAIRMIEERECRLDRVRRAGALCSNVCFNLSQGVTLKPEHRESARLAAAEWDSVVRS
jgi:hypothetical protein